MICYLPPAFGKSLSLYLKFVLKELRLKKRLLLYLLLAVICLVVPYAVVFLVFQITGSSDTAFSVAAIPIYLIIHYAFGILFLKTKAAVKYTVPLLAAYSSMFLPKIFDLPFFFMSVFHLPVYFAASFSLAFTSIITWEILYQILRRLLKNVPVE